MKLNIRMATADDIPALYRASEKMSVTHEDDYFEECIKRQSAGERDFFIAERNEILAGYVMLVWKARYQPFRNVNIPEIQDLSVIPSLRRQGIATQLIALCENKVRAEGLPLIGLGVGLHGRFGPAQQMYIRRGYVPDGAGAAYDSKTMNFGEMRPLDDNFTIKLVREL